MPSSLGHEGEDLFRIGAGIADRDQPGREVGGAQSLEPSQRLRQRAAALEIDSVLVVDLGRAVEADADVHVMSLEQRGPLVIDQDGVGGHAAFDMQPVRSAMARSFFISVSNRRFGNNSGSPP